MKLPLLPRRYRLGLASLVALTVLAASVSRTGGGGKGVSGQFYHVVGYAVLGFSFAYVLGRTGWRDVSVAFAGAFGYGLLIEIVQSRLPYRAFQLNDIVANALGASLGVGVYLVTTYLGFREVEPSELKPF
ncbi:MAG: VanZ family protein [Halobacteria archaeon]|nr:VanZ family protein [Halobacteria archaeon]